MQEINKNTAYKKLITKLITKINQKLAERFPLTYNHYTPLAPSELDQRELTLEELDQLHVVLVRFQTHLKFEMDAYMVRQQAIVENCTKTFAYARHLISGVKVPNISVVVAPKSTAIYFANDVEPNDAFTIAQKKRLISPFNGGLVVLSVQGEGIKYIDSLGKTWTYESVTINGETKRLLINKVHVPVTETPGQLPSFRFYDTAHSICFYFDRRITPEARHKLAVHLVGDIGSECGISYKGDRIQDSLGRIWVYTEGNIPIFGEYGYGCFTHEKKASAVARPAPKPSNARKPAAKKSIGIKVIPTAA